MSKFDETLRQCVTGIITLRQGGVQSTEMMQRVVRHTQNEAECTILCYADLTDSPKLSSSSLERAMMTSEIEPIRHSPSF